MGLVSDPKRDFIGTLRLLPLAAGQRHEKAAPVDRVDADLDRAIDRMLRLMRHSNITGLAGPVVGLPLRVIAVDLARSEECQIVLINPVIEEISSERHSDREGCVAIPGLAAPVERPLSITVSGLARSGQPVGLRAGGLLGRIIQHQIDHLDGIAFIDRLGPRERYRLEARQRARPHICMLP